MTSPSLPRALRGAALLGLALTSPSAWAEEPPPTGSSAPASVPSAPPSESAPEPEAAPLVPEASRLKLTFGGFLTGTMSYDTNRGASRPYLHQVGSGGTEDVLFFDAAGTRLNVGLESHGDAVVGRGLLELDFLGGEGPFSPRIRHAYAELETALGSIRLGQSWTLIGQHFPTSFNLDGLFLQGNPHNRLPQVTLSRKVGPLEASAGVFLNNARNGSATIVVDPALAGSASPGDNASPIYQARLGVTVRQTGFVAVAAALGKTRVYFSPTPGADAGAAFDSPVGMALATLDFSIPLAPLTLSGKLWYAASGGYSAGIGQLAVIDASGELRQLRSRGGWLDVAMSLGHQAKVSAYAAVDDPEDRVEGVAIPIARNLTLGATTSYEVMPKFILGLEGQYAQTRYAPPAGTPAPVRAEANALRLSLVAQYHL
ncbi:hypothetical protein [Pyxidicoccus xibeiensis]|uniref:hypothetical protein n=1 Tax=Pyxidicoccus xibeiensis TaxID=2906759 RepID=UPI0020A7163E|nr:hypothetical protein [Pyxidicoccus xibeiensis]MCP3141333.1 hypothetical protein [Pyxidicoccus xibeiensis]